MFSITIWRYIDLNHGPLVLETTTVPAEPQPISILNVGQVNPDKTLVLIRRRKLVV